MAILRWTPRPSGFPTLHRERERLRSHFESLWDSLAGAVEEAARSRPGVYPLLNLSEDADNLYLTAELAGVAAKDLELSVEKDSLTIRGERKIPETDTKVDYHRREREAGFFRRIVSLPVKVDAENIRAVMKEGVLRVTLPKAAEAKPRSISIESM